MRKKWLWSLFWIAIIVLLLYFILKDINFKEVYLILTYANPQYIFLAVLATALTFFVWAIRWAYVSGKLFKNDFWFLLNMLLAGTFVNTITPGPAVGGEPVRAHFLAKRYNKSRTSMLAVVLSDKFYQLIVLAALTIFSIFFIFIYFKISNTLKYILEAVLALILAICSATFYFILKKMSFRIGHFFKKLHFFAFFKKKFKKEEEIEKFVNSKMKVFLRVFRKSVKNKKVMAEAFFLAILLWLFNLLTTYFLFLAFGFKINFLFVIIVVPIGIVIGDLSFSPGGIGITELSMTLLFSAMGIFPPLALLVSFLSRLIYYLFSLVLGSWSLWYLRKTTEDKHG